MLRYNRKTMFKLSFNEISYIVSYLDKTHKRILYMTSKKFYEYCNRSERNLYIIDMLNVTQLNWFMRQSKKNIKSERLTNMLIKNNNLRLLMDRHNVINRKKIRNINMEVNVNVSPNMIKWLVDNEYITFSNAITIVIRSNNLELLKVLHNNRMSSAYIDITNNTLLNTSNELRNWLINNNYIDPNQIRYLTYINNNPAIFSNYRNIKDLFDDIYESEDFDLLKHIIEVLGIRYPKEEVELEARCATGGLYDMFKYLYLHNIAGYHDNDMCNTLAESGDLELLQWIYDNNGEINDSVCLYAIKHGNFEILQWLYTIGKRLDNIPGKKQIYTYIVRYGDYEIFTWMYKQLRSWNDEDYVIIKSAIRIDHLSIIKYAILHNCKYENDYMYNYSIKHNSINVLTWLIKQNHNNMSLTMDNVILILQKNNNKIIDLFKHDPMFIAMVPSAKQCIKNIEEEYIMKWCIE